MILSLPARRLAAVLAPVSARILALALVTGLAALAPRPVSAATVSVGLSDSYSGVSFIPTGAGYQSFTFELPISGYYADPARMLQFGGHNYSPPFEPKAFTDVVVTYGGTVIMADFLGIAGAIVPVGTDYTVTVSFYDTGAAGGLSIFAANIPLPASALLLAGGLGLLAAGTRRRQGAAGGGGSSRGVTGA